MKKLRTKAFTLTELLVVVIVLGVLAAVAAPKFTRVLETRRTTEAEDMLKAVRTEQEKRCTMGQNYTGSFSKISTLASLSVLGGRMESANYTYTLTETGVSANRQGKSYALKMPSYKSGQICCEGSGCDELNKDYPLCGSLPAVKDECAATDVDVDEPELTDPCDIDPNSCECKPNQAKCCGPNEVWNGHSCEKEETECDKDPADCPGGYYNSDCICITCDSSDNLRLNAFGTACECSITSDTCRAQGKALSDLSDSEPFPRCSCLECRFFSGYTGTSSDGTKEGCQKDDSVCPLTVEDCAAKGLVLFTEGGRPESECACYPCEKFGKIGLSTNGYSSGCQEKYDCDLTPEDCGRQGLVLKTNVDGSCSCRPCDDYGRPGALSWTGYSSDCSACEDNVCINPWL